MSDLVDALYAISKFSLLVILGMALGLLMQSLQNPKPADAPAPAYFRDATPHRGAA